MDRCENNRKVALSRWRNVRARDANHLQSRSTEAEYGVHLARVLAYIAADGCVLSHVESGRGNRHADIRFYPDDAALVTLFTKSIEYLYQRTPAVRPLQKYYRISVTSQVAVAHLQSHGDFGATQWRVPLAALTTMKMKREWLRAFFDCEGYVGKRYVRVESVNQTGLDDVQKLLEEFGIPSRRYVYVRKNQNWGVNYILTIAPRAARKQFLIEIGFNHTRKDAKLHAQCFENGKNAQGRI